MSSKEKDYEAKHVNRILARLYFGRDLQGTNWLSEINRESIGRMVHYGGNVFISDHPLTCGGLIDNNPSYVTDTCTRVLAVERITTREKFLAYFLELLLTKKQSKKLKLSRDIEQLDSRSAKNFGEMIKNYLIARQIPAEDLYTAVGIYILQKAHDRKVLSITDRITPTGKGQQLEGRVTQ